MSVDGEVRRLHASILRLKGFAYSRSEWWDLGEEIGKAWQRGVLSDDEAKDLETMMRSFRFPKK